MATCTEQLPHGWKRALRDYVRDVERELARAARPDDPRLADAVELLRENLRVPEPALTDEEIARILARRRREKPAWRAPTMPLREDPPKLPAARAKPAPKPPKAKPAPPETDEDELDEEA